MRRQSASNGRGTQSDAVHVAVIPREFAGLRADQALAKLFPDYSRSRLQQWIRDGHVTLNARPVLPRLRVHGGERVKLVAERRAETGWAAECLALTVVYEDEELIVVNKPAGMVVHPGAGNRAGTLVNALLNYDAELSAIPRAGLVHRIDKDTTGLLLVARTLRAYKGLLEQLASRRISRVYDAIVVGRPSGGGRIEGPIGRHRVHRTRMAVVDSGKPAATRYEVLQRFAFHSYVRLSLETGRTHQIRVHMARMGHPLVGDPIYGGRQRIPKQASPPLGDALHQFKRQALHAAHLRFEHPNNGHPMTLEAPLPEDMASLLRVLAQGSTAM